MLASQQKKERKHVASDKTIKEVSKGDSGAPPYVHISILIFFSASWRDVSRQRIPGETNG